MKLTRNSDEVIIETMKKFECDSRKTATLKVPSEDDHDTELEQSKEQVAPRAKKQRLESERTKIEIIEINGKYSAISNDPHFQCHICHQSMLKCHLQRHFRTRHNWKNAWKCHQCEQIFEFAKEFSVNPFTDSDAQIVGVSDIKFNDVDDEQLLAVLILNSSTVNEIYLV